KIKTPCIAARGLYMNILKTLAVYFLALVFHVPGVFKAEIYRTPVTNQRQSPCSGSPCRPGVCPAFHTFIIQHPCKNSDNRENDSMDHEYLLLFSSWLQFLRHFLEYFPQIYSAQVIK